jgi:undecaprenyl-diphosphatase
MLFEQFDLPILRLTTSLGGQSAAFDNFVGILSRFDTFKGVTMMALLWMAWFYRVPAENEEQTDARQKQVLITFIGSIAAVVVSRIMQRRINIHMRPALDHLGLNFPVYPDSLPLNTWSSFPSDHTMLFVAIATGLWRVNRAMSYFAFFWAFVVISLPRVYLGIHYPSDVVSGAVLGILFMLAFERLPLEKLAVRGLAWQKLHPGLFLFIFFFATDALAHLFDDIRNITSPLLHSLYGGS